MAETIGRADIIIEANGDGFEMSVRRQIKKAEPGAEKGGSDLRQAVNRGFTNKKHDKDVDNAMGRLGKRLDSIATKMSKGFGKGSRNDFLNLFGSFMGLAPRLLASLAKLGSGFGKLGKDTEGSGDGVLSLVDKFKGFASAGLPGLIAAAAAVGVAIQGSMALMGAFGAALSLTTGLVLALAGSLGFALVGGLAAVAGALFPFAAALGVGALAMAGLSKKSDAMKDLGKQWKSLQKDTAGEIFGDKGKNLEIISGLLKTVKPLILAIAGALGDLFESFGKVAQSKGFQEMIDHLAKVLPPMVNTLGRIAGNIGVFLIRAFVAAEPVIKQFLGWLEDLTAAMADMGKGGKMSTLAGIFDQGARSAGILWRLIQNVLKIIGKLFSAGAATGDSVLEGLADAAEDLNKWLSDPANADTINQWFIDAGKLAGKLGEIVKAVIRFVDALDTPTSREMLFNILDGVTSLINAFTTVAGWVDKFNQTIVRVGSAIFATVSGWPAFFQDVWRQITEGWDTVAQGFIDAWEGVKAYFGPAIDNILTFVQGFVDGVIRIFTSLADSLVGNSIIPDMINSIVDWFARLPGMIAGVLGDLAGRFVIWLAGVPQKIQSSIGLVVGAFGGLAQKAIARAGNIASGFAKWVAGLPAKAKAMATTIAAGFSNLAGKIISKAGSIAARFASWVSSLAGKARSTVTSVISAFGNLAGKIISKAGSIAAKFASWMSSLPGKAKSMATSIINAFSGLAGKIVSKAGDLAAKLAAWGRSAVSKAGGVANDIVSKFSGLASRIVNAIGNIVPKIKMPTIKVPTVVAKVITPKKASGGIISGPQHVIVGEAGPEAIVPLDRALSRVDPAVRALSAFAQGMTPTGGSTAPTIGRQIDVGGITINTPTEDPRAVASEVVNRMTFAAYI